MQSVIVGHNPKKEMLPKFWQHKKTGSVWMQTLYSSVCLYSGSGANPIGAGTEPGDFPPEDWNQIKGELTIKFII